VIRAQSSFEFAPWTDLSADTIKIELWAKTCQHPSGSLINGKGKQKEIDRDDSAGEGVEWGVLEQWDFNLADLVPLTHEVCGHKSH